MSKFNNDNASSAGATGGAVSRRGSALQTKYNQMLGCITTETIDEDLQSFMVDVMALRFGEKAKIEMCTGLIQARANAAIKLAVFSQMEKIKQDALEYKNVRLAIIKGCNQDELNQLAVRYEDAQDALEDKEHD